MKVRVPASLGADLRRLELLDVGAAVAELEATLGAELPVVQIAAVPRHPLPAEPELRVDGGAVADQLFNTGITPVDIEETHAAPAGGRSILQMRFGEPKVELADLMLFSRQMYTLLKSGVPIMRALGGLE